jgi:hypothetical protein
MVESQRELRPLYSTMLVLGLAAILIFALGFVIFLRFAPLGQATGQRAHVLGVFAYDPTHRDVSGAPSTQFSRTQPFAAEVDWAGLPPTMVVAAQWYNTLGEAVGGLAPDSALNLAGREALVAVRTPPGLHANLPGHYTLTVVRYSGRRPVELLARQVVLVVPDR